MGGRPRRAGARARLTLSRRRWRRRLLCFVRRGETPTLPPAPRGGAGAAPGRRRRRRLSVRNAGRGGSVARGLGGRFEWSRGAEGGGGRRRPQRGWGTAAPEGQEAWPAPRARRRPQCSEAAAATASAGRGVGARAAWRPRARSRRGRRTKLSASSAGRCPGPPVAVSVAAATIAWRWGFSGYVVTGPTQMSFGGGGGRGSVGRTPNESSVAWKRALAAPLG